MGRWKHKLLELTKKAALLSKVSNTTAECLEKVIKAKRSMPESTSSSSSSNTSASILAEVDAIIAQEMANFDAEESPLMKKMRVLLDSSAKSGIDMDEELEVIDHSFHESDTKCPFTMKVFTQPMKRFLTLSSYY